MLPCCKAVNEVLEVPPKSFSNALMGFITANEGLIQALVGLSMALEGLIMGLDNALRGFFEISRGLAKAWRPSPQPIIAKARV